MLTKLKAIVSRFKSNIVTAVTPTNREPGTVLVIAIFLLFMTTIVFGLTILFVSLFNWPAITIWTLIVAALARVLYAGFTGR